VPILLPFIGWQAASLLTETNSDQFRHIRIVRLLPWAERMDHGASVLQFSDQVSVLLFPNWVITDPASYVGAMIAVFIASCVPEVLSYIRTRVSEKAAKVPFRYVLCDLHDSLTCFLLDVSESYIRWGFRIGLSFLRILHNNL